MADSKLSAFAVSLVFEDGPIVTATYLAPDAMMALALVAVDAARQTADKKLTGYSVQGIGAEWLRHALKVVEGEQPKAPVFSLVSDNLRQPHDPRPFARDCGHNVTLVVTPRGYECPVCLDMAEHLMPVEAPDPA